jgi:hypothetical protein
MCRELYRCTGVALLAVAAVGSGDVVRPATCQLEVYWCGFDRPFPQKMRQTERSFC